jgi:selenocysteine lyase/cysteine desulfurase
MAVQNWKPHYSRFLKGHEGYLHLCAHSHHFWLDVTREAQLEAWDDAALLSDRKWDRVMGQILPDVQKGVAQHLGLSAQAAPRISFAPNTHEFYNRLLSCFESHPQKPIRVLSTDSEFHSFRRQTERLSEKNATNNSSVLESVNVSQFPRDTLCLRLVESARIAHSVKKPFDIIFLSHVFFNTGGVLPDCEKLLKDLVPYCRMLVLDTYHSFLAIPFSMKNLENEVYILGGGYKYAMGGEGVCFLYTPPKAEELRPANTGWFAHFEALEAPQSPKGPKKIDYSKGAMRFWGSTFDPSGLYRMRAVLQFLQTHKLDSKALHAHSLELQEHFLQKLQGSTSLSTALSSLKKASSKVLPSQERGNFLSFPLPPGEAKKIQEQLASQKILCDSRESGETSYLRLGFGLYHDLHDLKEIFK